MNLDYATLLSGVMIIGKFVGNGLVSLNVMAYQRKLLWHIKRAPGILLKTSYEAFRAGFNLRVTCLGI